MEATEPIVSQLARNHDVFQTVLDGVADDEFRFKPEPNAWNLLEITCHLYDEERFDFRARIKYLFEHPGSHPPGFNPLDWVVEHRYAQQDYQKMVGLFLQERKNSLDWLRSLEQAPWDHHFEHHQMGQMSAGLFLSNWLAHDYLHLRQIAKRKYEYLTYMSGDSLTYAGTL